MWMKKTILIALFLCLAGSMTSFADIIVHEDNYEDRAIGSGTEGWLWANGACTHTGQYADYAGSIVREHTGNVNNSQTGPVDTRYGYKTDIAMSGNTSADPADYTIELDIRNVQGDWDPHPIEIFVLTYNPAVGTGTYGYGLPTLDINQADGWVHVKYNLADLATGWWEGSNWDMTNPTWSYEIGGSPYPGTPVPAGESWTQVLLVDNLKITMITEAATMTELAKNPFPEDEEPDVCRDVVLSWTPGIYAPVMNGHQVFFSDDFNDVNEGVDGVIQNTNTYTPPELPEWGTTYYWRVDEANSITGWDQGDVWQFTVEPFTYAIENITATASSNVEGKEPLNTLTLEGDLHSTNTSEMWLSDIELPGQAWIEYDFDKAYKLHQMWVWNYNGEFPLTWYGLNDVTIEYSLTGTDGDWMPLEGVPNFNQAPGSADYAHNTTVNFGGEAAKYVRITANSNHSNGVFDNYGLSEVRFFYVPVRARDPIPGPQAPDIAPDVILTWRSGREATEHHVYFSSSEQAVTENTVTPEIVPGDGCEASYDPGYLDLSTTYYWKVNEISGDQVLQGDVWSFTTADYLVVDDMEFYGDSNVPGEEGSRVFYVWRDGFAVTNPYPIPGNGTASQVGHWPLPIMETAIAYAGRQSMPFYYFNDGTHSENPNVYFSEITAQTSDLPIGNNWTQAGVKALTLWFYGNPENDANDTEQMYVKLNGEKINYDGDMNDIREASWHEWNIELAAFGIDPNNVTEIAIGFGDETNATPAGSGMVYFDDIRLYPPRCIPSRLKPAADLNDDCVVDYADLEVLIEEWLGSDYLVTPQQPSATGLIAHYTFDGNASDSSGQGNDGAEYGGAYTTGKIGQAISLEGVDDYVDLPLIGPIIGSLTNCTVTSWVNFSNAGGAWQRIFDFGNDDQVYMYLTPRTGTAGPMRFAITTGSAGGEIGAESPTTLPSGWHHVAVTISDPNTAATRTIRLYLDGTQVGMNTQSTLSPQDLGATENNWLGRSQWDNDAYFMGSLDDFRIYDRSLAQAEIAGLAGRTETFSEPFDLNIDGTVDLSDYAILADKWLEEQLWPQL